MRFGIGLIFSLCVFAAQPATAANCPGESIAREATSAFQRAARSGSAQGFSSAASRYADFRALAMFALGRYRPSLPAGQTEHYVSLTRDFIGRFMADNASRFPSGRLAITGCSGGTVLGRFEDGGSITFRVRGSRIDDVSIGGFSIATGMRNKFTGIIDNNNGDVNSLIKWLERQ